MSSLARIVVEQHGAFPVVAIEGEVDASNATEISRSIDAALSNHSIALVVDLTETGYLDSAGINLLFALGARLRDRQQRLLLVVDPASPVARIVAISGLAVAERTEETRAAALEQAHAGL
ncbi:STAS domain-containing protein [Conexibacter arvalis]|uniref:Anti-sigma factor antagonist n=1 Tax=Conexibacter arvalis TaxID=912552 RepID=A0A840IC21_9ACTN|nr:STAS domain-containing protein [Conexibacter arvalis]MBB4662262.1 anti-anti-sigma factor [Conexibacter arvalis]